jgi:glycosyltransferase involved in cell wall biosynthesis
LFPWRLWRCLRSVRPRAVVSHVSLSSACVLAVARSAGVPIRVARMWSEADERSDRWPLRARRAVLRRVLRWAATDVVGVTAAALAFAGPRPGDGRYRPLYNAVDTDRATGGDRRAARRHLGIAGAGPVVVHLGRAHPVKNRPYLLDVHRALRRRRPDAVLLFAGPGGTADLTAADPHLAAEESVRLAGEVPEIAPVLAAADVLVLPSRREGLPGVVLEALAAGVPVVATDLPCLVEVAALVDGLRLLPLAAGPERWADAVAEAATVSAARRADIAAALLDSPFRLDRAAAQWTALWAR